MADVAVEARRAPGCLDFVQAADPIAPERINVYERWVSDGDLLRFRDVGRINPSLPPLAAADVAKYFRGRRGTIAIRHTPRLGAQQRYVVTAVDNQAVLAFDLRSLEQRMIRGNSYAACYCPWRHDDP